MLFSIFFILLSVIDPKYVNGFVSNFGFTANKYEFKKRKHNAWLDNTVTAKIPASLESTWELFTDLEKHPIWSPWLDEVQYHSNQKKFEGISLWTLEAFGMKFSWRAKNIEYSPPHRLAWESIDGFRNKGLVEIKPISGRSSSSSSSGSSSSSSGGSSISSSSRSQQTELTLTISYDLPDQAAAVVERITSVNHFVQETLAADLKRFSSYMNKQHRLKRMNEYRNKNKEK